MQVKLAGEELAVGMFEARQLAKDLIEGTVLSSANYANMRNDDAALRENIQVAEILRSADPEQSRPERQPAPAPELC